MKYFVGFLASFLLIASVSAQKLEVIPESKNTNVGAIVESIGVGGQVTDNYNKEALKLQASKDLGAQMASGVFTWDTLLDYLAYLIRFFSEIGLFVGACFVIYAGYLYATSALSGDSGATSKGNTAIKNAVIGVIVIVFSYAIMKAITSAFLT